MPQSTSSMATSVSSAALSSQWHIGHAVTSPKRCCTAYRNRYVLYAATGNAVAMVDVTAAPSANVSVEARWRTQMRVFSLSTVEEEIEFVAGHPERDVVCIGTRRHGLYVTSLSQPIFAESSKLPRAVTGDVTFGATFLFTAEANYLAFSSLLQSRPVDPAPYRLSLWCLETHALLWRGAMEPLVSMCSLSFDLSFAACQAGKVCLFTVQTHQHGSNNNSNSNIEAATAGEAGSKTHSGRDRLLVLSRHCSTVEELQDAHYTCCIAGAADAKDTYLALTTHGFLVAFHARSGAVTRWMDCKVPTATGLCLHTNDSLVLTSTLTRFFQVGSWEFQGKIKLELPAGLAAATISNNGEEGGGAAADVFTSAVTADSNTLLLFYSSGAMSLHSVERKAGTHRLSFHRTAFIPSFIAPCVNNSNIMNGTVVKATSEVQWLVVSAALWCWWTPRLLLFVSAASGALIAAYAVHSTCVTHQPASGTVILYDTQRRALLAYGRTSTSPVAEVGTLVHTAVDKKAEENEGEETITSLASSATGESFYALVCRPKSALPPRLRRYRCGWCTVKKGDVSEKVFYMDSMKVTDSGVAPPGSSRTSMSLSLPAGTHSLLVYAGGPAPISAAAGTTGAGTPSSSSVSVEGDCVLAIQRNTIASVGLSSSRERAAAPTYTHPDVIQRVLPCCGGLLVVAASSSAFVQWKGSTAFRWIAKPLFHAAHNGSTGGTAAVASHRSGIAVVCVERALTVWQLSDSPRPLASCTIGAAPAVMLVDVEESTRRVRFYVLGGAGVDAYELDVAELRNSAVATAAGKAEVALMPSVTSVNDGTQKAAAKPPTLRITKAVPPPPPPPSAPMATATAQRQVGRAPRILGSTVSSRPKTLAEARRQRRTASAGAPSSRQLNERFDELTGFYARQKQENESNEHPRTPRMGGGATSRHLPQPPQKTSPVELDEPQSAVLLVGKEGDNNSLPTSSTSPRGEGVPNLRAAHATAFTVNTATSASAIDVSALTVDSQMLRSAVAAATLPRDESEEKGEVSAVVSGGDEDEDNDDVHAGLPTSSPLQWSNSPRPRGDPRRDPASAATPADDVLLGSSVFPNRAPPPQPQPRQHPSEDISSSFTSEEFTVQARHLRESLLHIKEFLEQSEMAESNAASSMDLSDVADLDELASLLTTVAAQLHQRQGRRSTESA